MLQCPDRSLRLCPISFNFCQSGDVAGADGEFGVAVAGAGNHGEGHLGHGVAATKQTGDGVERDEPVLHLLDAALPFGPTHECRPACRQMHTGTRLAAY